MLRGPRPLNVRRTKLTLWSLAAMCAAAATLSLTAAVALPLELRGGEDYSASLAGGSGASRSRPATSPSDAALVTALAPVLDMRLRQPLGQQTVATSAPAAPVETAPAAVASDLPPYTLVGTIGDSLALLRGPDGGVEIRGVNESVNGVEIVSIGLGEARVRYNGKVVRLEKPKEPPLPGEDPAPVGAPR